MSERWTTALSAALVAAGILAELNLLRVFIGDWLNGRREGRKQGFRKTPHSEGRAQRRAPMHPRLAVCVVGLPAVAATAQDTGTRPACEDDAPATQLSLDEPRLRFTKPLQPGDVPSAHRAETQPVSISTNRPSFNDTTGIVPIGHFQLETGYTFTYRNRSGAESQTHNAPELLGRIPLLEDRVELQLGTSGYVWSRTDDGSGSESTQGFSDMTVGLRLKVTDQDHWLPRIALQASTTTGLGTDGISNQDVEPSFKFIWSYDLGDGWGVYGNFGVGYLTVGPDRFVQGQGGGCVTKTLNDKWSIYAEYYAFGPNSKGTDAAHYLDVGAAYLVTPRIQLDSRIGFGLNQEANNVFTGFGISVLF